MNNELQKRNEKRARRQMRIRRQVRGSAGKPRLCVHRSNKHVWAQLIDDESHTTLVSAGTLQGANKAGDFGKKSKAAARHVGLQIAQMAKEKNINSLVFDRGRYKFHGVIAELAEGAREGGLQF